MRIKGLHLRAKVVVESFLSGRQRSRYHGFSVEFSEYRRYTPGDDPRALDWRLYARTDRHYVKRFDDETNLACHLILDVSRSMAYGTESYSKWDYAATLAATLAHYLAMQRNAVGVITVDEGIRSFLPARYRPGHLRRLLLALDRPADGRATDLGAPLAHIAQLLRKRGLVIIISDLLLPVERWEVHLRALPAHGHDLVVFRVLDPSERVLQDVPAGWFVDLESGRRLDIDPSAIRQEYARRFADHEAALRSLCDRTGIEWHVVQTTDPLERVLFDFLSSRQGRGRRARPAWIRSARAA